MNSRILTAMLFILFSLCSGVFATELLKPDAPLWIRVLDPGSERCVSNSNDLTAMQSWTKQSEEIIAADFRKREQWNKSFARTSVCFLIDKSGRVKDPIIWPEKNSTQNKLLLSEMSGMNFPPPPNFLSNRRVLLTLVYPNFRICADLHDEDASSKAAFFERLKKQN